MAAMTKSERLAQRRLIYHLWLAGEDRLPMRELRDEVPDAPVAKMFKGMGGWYQARINRILATWVEMKIGHVM